MVYGGEHEYRDARCLARAPHLHVAVDGLEDGTPFLTIVTRCSCGEELTRSRFDARDPGVFTAAEAAASTEADLAVAHLEAHEAR